MSACLHAETSVMDPEHEIRALAITTLADLPVGLMRGRPADVAIQTKFDGHPGSLGIPCEESIGKIRSRCSHSQYTSMFAVKNAI